MRPGARDRLGRKRSPGSGNGTRRGERQFADGCGFELLRDRFFQSL
jgi:hypothetical protein